MAVDAFGGRAADSEAEDFLAGAGSVTAVKFPVQGHKIGGTVVGWQMQQQTDKDTGELKYFEARKLLKESDVRNVSTARPAMELLLDIQYPADSPEIGRTWKTNQYVEEEVPDDDGLRRWYVSGENQKALSEALKEAGAKLEKGAYIEAVRTGTKKFSTGYHGFTFKVRWTKAADNVHAAQEFLSEENPWA